MWTVFPQRVNALYKHVDSGNQLQRQTHRMTQSANGEGNQMGNLQCREEHVTNIDCIYAAKDRCKCISKMVHSSQD